MRGAVREAAATSSATYVLRDVDFTESDWYGLRRTRFKWKWMARDCVVLDIEHVGQVHAHRLADGVCVAEMEMRHRGRTVTERLPVTGSDLDQCCAGVETYIKAKMSFAVSFLEGIAARQSGPATDRQKALVRRLYGKYGDTLKPGDMSAAQAAMLIYKALARSFARRRAVQHAQAEKKAKTSITKAPLMAELKTGNV